MEVHLGTVPAAEPSAVTIGFFDGVHLGHRAVIGRTVERARAEGLRALAVTFDRHPLQTLSPGKVPPLLTTLRRKAELIERLGVDLLFVLEFTEGVSRWPPVEFIDRILVRGLGARLVCVGANFTFGHRASGNVDLLHEVGPERGLSVEAIGLHKLNGRPVSSTAIREALAEGELAWPARALARPYDIEGTVVRGAGRGVGLGWPTANLRTPAGLLLPGRGVYAGVATVEGRRVAAAVNVGVNPTFGSEPLHVEAHLLDFDADLLGKVLRLEFHERLREETRFETPEALSRQIGEDVERTRSLVSDALRGAEEAV